MGARLQVQELGHVSLFVRDLEASVRFYRDVLALSEVGRGKDGKIAFFSAGLHHHDLSLEAARTAGPERPEGAPGLYHIAFKVGATPEALEEARRWVEAQGLAPFGEIGGRQSASFSVRDPDGHQIELYVDLENGGSPVEGRGPGAPGKGVTRRIATTPPSRTRTTNPKAQR